MFFWNVKTELHWEEPSYVLAPQFWQSVSARKHDAKGLLNARKQPACLDLGAPWKALKPFQSYATWKDHRVSYPVRYQLLPIWRNLGPSSRKASLLSWCFMSFIFHRLKFSTWQLWCLEAKKPWLRLIEALEKRQVRHSNFFNLCWGFSWLEIRVGRSVKVWYPMTHPWVRTVYLLIFTY